MKIKDRLALYFTLISAVILIIAMGITLIIFNKFVTNDFYSRLLDRAKVASQLYLEADEIPVDSLNRVKERFLKQLPNEIVRFYDQRNSATFIEDRQQYWSSDIINEVRKRKELEFAEGELQTVGINYVDNQGNYVILVSANDVQGKQKLKELLKIMAIMMLVAVAGLFGIGRWFAWRMLAPIDKLVTQMKLVRANNLSLRVNEGNGKDEISVLAQSFNKLLRHLENAFELQQTFVTNASHELRTPVTSIIGEIEVALNKSRTVEEYQELLSSMLIESERLNETITGLLELAQVDMNFTQAALSPVAIDDLIWELQEYWTKKLGKNLFNVNILELPEEQESLSISANRSLLLIAFNNIIGNAFKFSNDQPVTCSLYADAYTIKVYITDLGIGILEEEKEKIFNSFFRGTNAASIRGNGIGLYVTSKIVSLFNGVISLISKPGEGTTFVIEFIR